MTVQRIGKCMALASYTQFPDILIGIILYLILLNTKLFLSHDHMHTISRNSVHIIRKIPKFPFAPQRKLLRIID